MNIQHEFDQLGNYCMLGDLNPRSPEIFMCCVIKILSVLVKLEKSVPIGSVQCIGSG